MSSAFSNVVSTRRPCYGLKSGRDIVPAGPPRAAATNLFPTSNDAHAVPDRGNARVSVRTLLPLADCLRALLRVSREDGADGQPCPGTQDQLSIAPANKPPNGSPDPVGGAAAGSPVLPRRDLCRHDGPDASTGSPAAPEIHHADRDASR
jgi:hypothetical protein